MADTTRSAHSLLAAFPSQVVSLQIDGRKRASPVDGPFAETKEWIGCGTLSSKESGSPKRRTVTDENTRRAAHGVQAFSDR